MKVLAENTNLDLVGDCKKPLTSCGGLGDYSTHIYDVTTQEWSLSKDISDDRI